MRALVIGRFHAVTAEQANWIVALGADPEVTELICVVTSADHVGTRRNPLDHETRIGLIRPELERIACPHHIVEVRDIPDDAAWVAHIERQLAAVGIKLSPSDTLVHSANHSVQGLFAAAGYAVASAVITGPTPHELLQRIVEGKPWRDLASGPTRALFDQPAMLDKLRAIFADTLRTEDGELGHQRDFDSYGAQMDASLRCKLDDLLPWIRPGLVVDKGCGTGKLLVELSRKFPQSTLVGVDLSREFLRRCDQNRYFSSEVDFVQGDAAERQIESGRATTVIFSSIMHEIYSYSDYSRERVEHALRSAFEELGPGGHLLIRDGISPSSGMWRMRFLRPDVARQFEKFATEFKHGCGVKWERVNEDTVRLSAHDANEFLCKKDYLQNWHIEVHEEFGVFTLAQWRELLECVGFVVCEAKEYVNDWIRQNRYVGSVALFDDAGEALQWPATNAVIVGEKPEHGTGDKMKIDAARAEVT